MRRAASGIQVSPLNPPDHASPARWRTWYVGAALWLLATLLSWPGALSFADGVGYLGQARLLLEGQLRPGPESVGFWIASPAGELGKYPLFFPLLVAPLFALAPALVFAIGVGATAFLSWVTAHAADRWTGLPAWGLLVLLHPTHTLLARTLTPDALLCALALGAWWALERRHIARSAVLCALLALVKPVGILVALALAAGLLPRVAAGGAGTTRARLLPAALLGTAVGIGAVTVLNLLATGTIHYAYRWAHPGRNLLSAEHLWTIGAVHARSLLLVPPLLLLGAWWLWKRRAWGPLLASIAVLLPMSFYWFVDAGRSLAESTVLAPRLILPAVAFLTLGYIDGLHRLLGPDRARRVTTLLVIAAPVVAGGVGFLHDRSQADGREARVAMEQLLRERGESAAAVNYHALEAAMLTRFDLVRLGGSSTTPCVLHCNHGSSSNREPGSFRCEPEGYETLRRIGSYHLFAPPACARAP